jgi:ABC-2 type transport system permease protein
MIVVGKILGTSKGIQDFGLFVFSGFLAYQIFVNTSLVAMRSVVENSELVKRISFPRIFLPISAAVVALTDAMLNFAVLFVGYVYYGSWPSLLQLKYLPLAFCIAYSFGLAVGIWGAVLNTKLRDLGQLFEVLVNLGIWLTPIFYSYTFVARAFKEDTLLLNLYLYNPMVNAVLAFQKALWPPASLVDVSIELFPGRMDVRLATLTVLGVLTLMISLGFFTSKANRFSEQL